MPGGAQVPAALALPGLHSSSASQLWAREQSSAQGGHSQQRGLHGHRRPLRMTVARASRPKQACLATCLEITGQRQRGLCTSRHRTLFGAVAAVPHPLSPASVGHQVHCWQPCCWLHAVAHSPSLPAAPQASTSGPR